jgi:hypothetical protein
VKIPDYQLRLVQMPESLAAAYADCFSQVLFFEMIEFNICVYLRPSAV